jgi:hypothetical protein
MKGEDENENENENEGEVEDGRRRIDFKIVWLQNGRGWRRVWAHGPFGVQRKASRRSLHPIMKRTNTTRYRHKRAHGAQMPELK